jgi:hypothetical protein
MSDRWTETTFHFRFQLGEVAFAARAFPIARREGSFIDFAPAPDALELPRELDDRVVAYVVMSQPIGAPLPRVSLHRGTVRWAAHQYRHHYVRFAGTFDEYLKKQFSGQARNGLKRKVRKYCDQVKNQNPFREYRTPEELRVFYRHARQVSLRTYQEKLLGKGLPDGAEDEWAELAAQGIGRGYLLFDGDKPVAYMTGELRNGILLNDYQGFDPDYRNLSPGIVLQYLALQPLFANPDNVRIWDFGEGEGPHKELFATDSLLCADLFHFPRRPRALALFAAEAGLHFASRGIVGVLDRYGLKERVKRLLRRRGEHAGDDGAPGDRQAATSGDGQTATGGGGSE